MTGNDLMRIGDFARHASTNLRTLRYYEELGLIRPASRSSGGFRYYEESQLARVTAIRRLQELGLSLKEIADTIGAEGPAAGPVLLARVEESIRRRIELVDEKIQTLQSDLRELEESRLRLIERCKSCELPFSRVNCDPCALDGRELPDVIRALLV